jgi:D-tyrosyl-tRNA(Tyr) deacylase
VKVVLQRVGRASVTVNREQVASIGRGYLLLVGIGSQDADDEVERMAEKVGNLRLFADDDGKKNLALADVRGEILVVSQFTPSNAVGSAWLAASSGRTWTWSC